MNRINELMIEHNKTQKELAIAVGVSRPTVSDWVNNKKDPRGENLQKVASFFGLDWREILYSKHEQSQQPPTWHPEYPSGVGLTDDDLQKIASLMSTNGEAPKTIEARILSAGVDKMPAEERERALQVMQLVFAKYEDYFKK